GTLKAGQSSVTIRGVTYDRPGSGISIKAVGAGGDANGLEATSPPFDVSIGPPSVVTSTVSADPTTVTADGSSTTTISVRLIDAYDNPLAAGGADVSLSTTLGAIGAVTDEGDGTYTAALTAPV